MIQFQMEGIEAQQDYLETVRLNILAAIRVGMYEGMRGLADAEAEAAPRRTGDLQDAILRSPRITEKIDSYIAGEVSTQTPKFRNKGLWIEFGISDPDTIGSEKGVLYGFTAADGKSVFTHGHRAFKIAPHPFFNPTFQGYYPTILEIINQRITEACDAAV